MDSSRSFGEQGGDIGGLYSNPFADDYPTEPPQANANPIQSSEETSHGSLVESFGRLDPYHDAALANETPHSHHSGFASENVEEERQESRHDDQALSQTYTSQDFQVPETGVKPTFEIYVEDPQKIGDPLTAHTVYKVHTKTSSSSFRAREFTVLRRYRDFLWLYNQLTAGNPGVIVPPIPEKHAVGRFQDEFIESRRIALEKCLRKIAAHPMLYGDPDFRTFLESDNFNSDIKQKRNEPDLSRPSFIKSFGETISNAATNPFSRSTSSHEDDAWFEQRRHDVETLEAQLKSLLKAIDSVIKMRRDLGAASFDFGDSMQSLGDIELDKPLARYLNALADLQRRAKSLHEQQARSDMLTLEHTVEEYIRIIGSIKASRRVAFYARSRVHQNMQYAESDLQRKQSALEKLKSTNKAKQDKLMSLTSEITEAEHRVTRSKSDFESISRLLRTELQKFDHEKVVDFQLGIENFLAGMVRNQTEIVELWQSYFLLTEDGAHTNITSTNEV